MSSSYRNGRAGASGSLKNYKYRRLSSVEKGSGNGYISCDEDEEEIFTAGEELKNLKGRSYNSNGGSRVRFITDYEKLVDRPIQSGETLTSISLKYRVPVAELKRINKIIQDSEFFALTSLKIPVKPHSVLSEMLDEEQKEANVGDGHDTIASTRTAVLGTRSVSSCSEYESEPEMHVGYISIDRILKDTRTKKEAKRFLDTMQKDLANIRLKTNSYKDSLDEAAAALNDLRFRPLEQSDQCTGADWGINWWKMLLIGLLLVVAVPLLYIYLYLQSK